MSLLDLRFPRIEIKDVTCSEYKQPAIDFSKLSCLLPGTNLHHSSLPSKNIRIKEPMNWMGVSISDLGRGYAWSDYIQLVLLILLILLIEILSYTSQTTSSFKSNSISSKIKSLYSLIFINNE